MVREPGGAQQLFIGETPTPQIGARDICINIRAAGVNRADILQRKGMYPPPEGASDVLGLEVAGEVARTGPDCRRWIAGDRVFAVISGGGYAQQAVFDERLAMPIPDVLDFNQAAAVGEVFLTAYQALVWLGSANPGETVLIHAGASGVGTAAIQIAGNYGCCVFVTAGTAEKAAACRKLGADVAIVYRQEDFSARVLEATDGRGADVIVDFVGASYFNKNLACIAADGRLVMLSLLGGSRAAEVDLTVLLHKRVRIVASTLRSRSLDYRARLVEEFTQQCLPKFASGELRPIVDRILPWQQVGDAHRVLEENRNIGKVVLAVG
jgi:putative PIG3 family NAD(P)H quinone oxidoreductase